MKESGFSLWVKLALALTFLVVLTLGFVTYRNTSILLSTDRLVVLTYHVDELAEQIISVLRATETAERGYLLTGDEKDLAHYNRAVEHVKPKLAELRELTADDEALLEHLDQMEKLASDQLAQMQEAIKLRQDNPGPEGLPLAREQLLGSSGRLSEEIAAKFAEILDHLRDLKETRELDAAKRAVEAHRSIIVGHTLALGMLLLAGVAMLSDRRRRSEAEARRQTSEERLSAIVGSAMDGIVVIDANQRITFMNPSAEAIIGCEHLAAIGEPLRQFIPEAKRYSFCSDLDSFRLSNQQSKRIYDGVALRADGREIRVECAMTKSDVEGQPFVTLMLRDLTERETHKAKIREQSAVLDQIRDAIHVCDLEGRVVYWNRGAEQLYGWNSLEATGRAASDMIIPSHPEVADEANRLTLEKGNWSGEILQRTKYGRDVLVEERRTLIRDEMGTANAQLVFDVDITDRKIAEEHQRRSQRLESIGTLAGGIAHDLNNVLTPILMGSKLLCRESASNKPQKVALTIQAAAERGADMIKQLLSFAGGKDGRREAVQPADVIHELQGMLEHTLPKSIELQIDMKDNLWPVVGDPTELCQLLLNLSINARDAMPNGGQLTIAAENFEVDESRSRANPDLTIGPHVMFSVSDTGIGIGRDIIDKIFDPFFTTKEHGKGTGLGLATCQGIVRGHGGAINVYSEPALGSEFTVYLPARRAADAATAVPSADELPQGHGELIMLVDDETMVLEIAGVTLEANGYRVLTANGGAEAVAIFPRYADEVRAVVVDIMMPGIDGLATMKALKEINPEVGIIASSGLRGRGRESRTLADAHAFLPKPYSDAQLLSTLKQVLTTAEETTTVAASAST